MQRTMRNTFEGITFYESAFDPQTGTLVRACEEPSERYRGSFDRLKDHLIRKVIDQWEDGGREMPHDRYEIINDLWSKSFGWRGEAFSPSPETVDISITDWCNFGCSYCYQDSTELRGHSARELVSETIKAFAHAPYQIAIGGGEPTSHPDFPKILLDARELGTVPNFTTAGHIQRKEVFAAANEVCGGVSLTYHAFKGKGWFARTYKAWREKLAPHVALNVHVLADRDVADSLTFLTELHREVGKVSVILLAYYPDVGRGRMDRVMPKPVYMDALPKAIQVARGMGMRIAFSEGLLPFFLSRQGLGVDTSYATRSEGIFSCYVDPLGRLMPTSFGYPPPDDTPTLFTGANLQAMWSTGEFSNGRHFGGYRGRPEGDSCYSCPRAADCAIPHDYHYLACAFAPHNRS